MVHFLNRNFIQLTKGNACETSFVVFVEDFFFETVG